MECQTDDQEDVIAELQTEINHLRASLLTRPEFDVLLLEYNDKLTRFYKGMSTYDSFKALVEYLEPKAKEVRVWKDGSTKTEEKQQGSQRFSNLSTPKQLFAILIQLRLGFLIIYISTHFKIPELPYSCMFTT